MAPDSAAFCIVLRVDHIGEDEWCVSMNGEQAIAFAGPDAERRAEQCARELLLRLDHANGLADAVIH